MPPTGRDYGKDDEPTSKGLSAAVRRRMMKSRQTGRSGRVSEDMPGWNPQTMGNRKYKALSKSMKEMRETGEARVVETPHGGRMGKHNLGMTEAAARRLESKKAGRVRKTKS